MPGCDAIIQSMCAAPEAVLRFLPEHVGELHPEKTLPRVGVPVLFVGAANPRFDSSKAALIRNFQLEQIPNAGTLFARVRPGPHGRTG